MASKSRISKKSLEGGTKSDAAKSGQVLPYEEGRHRRMAKRASNNKRVNQKALREKIAASGHHRFIVELLQEAVAIKQKITKMKTYTREDQAKHITQLQALKIALDGHFKLLNKYLPDLRSMEFKDPDGDDEGWLEQWAKAIAKK